jgi:hypothetical protein
MNLSETIEQRLINGEKAIKEAEERGEDTTRLIDFWIMLLHQYEDAADEEAEKGEHYGRGN